MKSSFLFKQEETKKKGGKKTEQKRSDETLGRLGIDSLKSYLSSYFFLESHIKIDGDFERPLKSRKVLSKE